MSEYVIRVDNLSKRYRIGALQRRHDTLRDTLAAAVSGTFSRLRRETERNDHIWALKDVSFEVNRGEVLGVIGRNGAGKSTLLKILSRITEPTRGKARIRGRVGSLLEVGTGFHPELTGRENVYLSGAILGMRRNEIERKFDEIVDFSGIEKFIDTPIKRYSSGMQVRLGFAVAAHLEPEVLLVDEVLAVGDAAFQKKCLGKMTEVAGQGRTVLFVSHNLNAINQLCTSAMLLDDGVIVAAGDPVVAVNTYMNRQQNGLAGVSLDSWRSKDRPHPFFTKIVVNGTNVPGEVTISTNQTLNVEMFGDTRDSVIRHFRAGVHVATQDGIRIMTYATPWSNIGDDLTIEGKVCLTCRVDKMQLVPGRYFLSFGCVDNHGPRDTLDDICLLVVTPDANEDGILIPTYKTHGYYLTSATWGLLKQAQST